MVTEFNLELMKGALTDLEEALRDLQELKKFPKEEFIPLLSFIVKNLMAIISSLIITCESLKTVEEYIEYGRNNTPRLYS